MHWNLMTPLLQIILPLLLLMDALQESGRFQYGRRRQYPGNTNDVTRLVKARIQQHSTFSVINHVWRWMITGWCTNENGNIWKNLPTETGEEIWLGQMDQKSVAGLLGGPSWVQFSMDLIEHHMEHGDSEEQALDKSNVIFSSVELGRDKRRRPIKLVVKAFKEE